MSNCETENCSTSTTKQTEACPVEQSLAQECCPVEKSVKLWNAAFFQAMRETQVDILKQKIQKAWGPAFEKEADAVLAAMGTHWRSILTQAKAQVDLRETIQKLYEQMLQK